MHCGTNAASCFPKSCLTSFDTNLLYYTGEDAIRPPTIFPSPPVLSLTMTRRTSCSAFVSPLVHPVLKTSFCNASPLRTTPQTFRPLPRTFLLPCCIQTVDSPTKINSPYPNTIPKPTTAAPKRSSVAPQLTAEGDSLSSTSAQKALVAAFCAACTALPVKLAVAASGPADITADFVAALAAYVFTDFAVGVYHHTVDNYGDANTPVFGCKSQRLRQQRGSGTHPKRKLHTQVNG